MGFFVKSFKYYGHQIRNRLYKYIISTTTILSERLYLPWDILEKATISQVTFLNINLADLMKQLLFFQSQTQQILQCKFLSPAALFKNKKNTDLNLLSTVQR